MSDPLILSVLGSCFSTAKLIARDSPHSVVGLPGENFVGRGDLMKKRTKRKSLSDKYHSSEPCNCDICLAYCQRPGWWAVEEAAKAIRYGYANRMMLEISPERTFGVLSPAFKGCEGKLALNKYANNGCNFLMNNLCEIYTTGLLPLECRFCHHERAGLGQKCHLDIEKEWKTEIGKAQVSKWAKQFGLYKECLEIIKGPTSYRPLNPGARYFT